jgi:CRISPR-associated protein Csb1
MFAKLAEAQRLLLECELEPFQTHRFQPTGFADIGAATYELPDKDGTRMLLVESAQSVANRLEATIVTPEGELIKELEGLPFIRAQLTGESDGKTTSLIEAHRINSPFIITDNAFQKRFVEQAEYQSGRAPNWGRIVSTVFRYDPNSVLHGCFLANLQDGRIRIQRAVSGFIEARDVREVVSGGVKNNPLDPTGKIRAKAHDKDVYGNVPYQRLEYTAGEIKAFFNVDVGLLRSYELGNEGLELLVGLALFKIRRFLRTGMRLRTACDLEAKELKATQPAGYEVPGEGTLLESVQASIEACKNRFADPPVTEITTETVRKKSEKTEEPTG